MPEYLGQSPDKPAGVALTHLGDSDPAPTTVHLAAGLLLDLRDVEEPRVLDLHQHFAGKVMEVAASLARHLQPFVGLQVRHLYPVLPAHQKSSAEGMRV